jgi:hypothetical protein
LRPREDFYAGEDVTCGLGGRASGRAGQPRATARAAGAGAPSARSLRREMAWESDRLSAVG